ncbi:hypothetical protein OAN61_00730, partial [bacterium]|nr:hypothetical protein [bacterium]
PPSSSTEVSLKYSVHTCLAGTSPAFAPTRAHEEARLDNEARIYRGTKRAPHLSNRAQGAAESQSEWIGYIGGAVNAVE